MSDPLYDISQWVESPEFRLTLQVKARMQIDGVWHYRGKEGLPWYPEPMFRAGDSPDEVRRRLVRAASCERKKKR